MSMKKKNIHKRNQLVQIAKNNGSLQITQFENDKAGELNLLQQSSGPLGQNPAETQQISNLFRKNIEQQYRRDIEGVKGIKLENIEEKFQKFMCELDSTNSHDQTAKYTDQLTIGCGLFNSLTKSQFSAKKTNLVAGLKRISENFNNCDGRKVSPYGGFAPLMP